MNTLKFKFIINGILRSITIGLVIILILDQFLRVNDKVFVLSIVIPANIILGTFSGLARFDYWKFYNRINK